MRRHGGRTENSQGRCGLCSAKGHSHGVVFLGPACSLRRSLEVFCGVLPLLRKQLRGDQSRCSAHPSSEPPETQVRSVEQRFQRLKLLCLAGGSPKTKPRSSCRLQPRPSLSLTYLSHLLIFSHAKGSSQRYRESGGSGQAWGPGGRSKLLGSLGLWCPHLTFYSSVTCWHPCNPQMGTLSGLPRSCHSMSLPGITASE